MRNVYGILIQKPEGMKPLGRPVCKLDDNVKMGLKEIGYKGDDWIQLVQDRHKWWDLVNTNHWAL
jgi:hypothetical protein